MADNTAKKPHSSLLSAARQFAPVGRDEDTPEVDPAIVSAVAEANGFPDRSGPKAAPKAAAVPDKPKPANTSRAKQESRAPQTEPAAHTPRRPGRPASRVQRNAQISPRIMATTYDAIAWFYDYSGMTQAEVIEAGIAALCRERQENGEDIPPNVI